MRKFVGKFLKHFFFFWVGVVELYSMQFFFFNNCLDLEEVMVCRLVSNSFFFFFQRLRLCLVECKIFSECKIFLGKENIFKCLAALRKLF